jgi:hypothetical protein
MAKIYQTFSMGEAQYKIHISENKLDADLWVYVVNNRGTAGRNGLWYITNNKLEANIKGYFCSRGMAELIVYFVNVRGEAGWQKPHRLKNIL